MKKNLLIVCLLLLSNCAQNSALLGPGYTLVSSGSVVEAGISLSASQGLKKATGKSSTDVIDLFEKFKAENTRECRTEHSSQINKIFFDTLDEIDCYRDPFSILR